MTSILTNTTAVSALQTLRAINGSLENTQNKVSSGMRVATASDDAAYWSIATTMRSDVGAMEAVSDSVGLAQGIVNTTYAAMETVRDSFVDIRNLAITASNMPQPGMRDVILPGFSLDPEYAKSDVYKIDVRMQKLQDQARESMMSASFAGVNMIYHSKTEDVKASEQVFSFVIGYSDGKVQKMDVKAMDTLLLNDAFGSYPTTYPGEFNPEKTLFDGNDIFDAPGSYTPASIYWYNIPLSNPDTGDPESYPVSKTQILQSIENHVVRHGSDRQGLYNNLVNMIDEKIQALTSKMAYVGSVQTALAMHDEKNLRMIDTVNRGVGRLVDADMAEESARLRALQTQQQLSVSALNIANSAPQNIMQLFN